MAKQAAVLARRDRPWPRRQNFGVLTDVPVTIERLLEEIQQAMYDKALAFRRSNTHAANYDQFKKAVKTGFARWLVQQQRLRRKIKEETRATMRCIPLDRKRCWALEAL